MNPAKRKPPLNVLRLSPYRLIKRTNSKGDLARACLQYQRALMWYADESHWAVRQDDIIMWVGDEDPTRVAEIVLGKRRPDSGQKGSTNGREDTRSAGGPDQPAGEEPRSSEPTGGRSGAEAVARADAVNAK